MLTFVDIYSSLGAMSRGKTLLLRSNSMKASSAVCGPVQFARTWKIPVVEVSVLRSLLKKENNHRKQVSSQSSKPSVKKLDKPFVKVEDAMQMYSTNFRLFNSFPMSYLSSLDSLPCNGAAASQTNESSVKKKQTPKRIKKCGYCECCDVSFTDQKEHLNSRMHKAFVMRNENFACLDALVSKLPSLEKFAFAVELDKKKNLSSGSITAVDPGLVHGLSDSQTQDHNLNPSLVRDVTVHGTKRLYPGSSTDLKHDVKNLCDAQNLKSNGNVLPVTRFPPNSSCPIRKPKTKKSQNTSSKSCAPDSDSFHVLEKYDGDRNLIRASDRRSGKLVNKSRMPNKGSHSDLNIDLNCPVDLSLSKSSTGVSSYQSQVNSLSTVSESNSPTAAVPSRKVSEVSKALKIDRKANKEKLSTSNCSVKVSDSCDQKTTKDQLVSELMDISLDRKLLATTVLASNAELRSPFLGSASAISKDVSKDDDLEFSSDEVSDSADEKVDWRINLRNSCNKVLNILEDSNSSKDLANDMPVDCINNSPPVKLELTNVQVADDCHNVSSNKKEFNFSNLSGLDMSGSVQLAHGILPGLDETTKSTASKVSSQETSMSCRIKPGGVGIVRPWEMVSNKTDPNQLCVDKEGHCNAGSQMLGASESSGCVLQTDSEQCTTNSNTVYRQIESSENCIAADTSTGKALLPEPTHSDDESDPQITHSTEGTNLEVTHLNEDSNPKITCSADSSKTEKAPSVEGTTPVKSDTCMVESAVLTDVSSCVQEKIVYSSAPMKVSAELSIKAVTPEILLTAVAESPTRFQDSPHSGSQSSIIVDVEACDERSDISEDRDQTSKPCYEPITPEKPHKPPSLEISDRGIVFGSNYPVFDQRVIGQSPLWPPMTPVLVNGQVIYMPSTVMGITKSPTVSQQLIGLGSTNAGEFLPGGSCELQMRKPDSVCNSLDSGFCASIKTATVDSSPGSPVENCARSFEEGEPSICERKCLPSPVEKPVSSPIPIPVEHPDSLPAAKQAAHSDNCTGAIPISSLNPGQCKTIDSVPLHGQSKYPVHPVTPKTPCSFPGSLQTVSNGKVNLHFHGEFVASRAASAQTQSFSSVSFKTANDDTSPVLSQTENNSLLSVSVQSRHLDCPQLVIHAGNSNSLPNLIQSESTDREEKSKNHEEKSDSCAAVSNTENQSYSSSVDEHHIDEAPVNEMECKDVLVHPTLPKTEVKTVDAVDDSAVQVQESPKVGTVPEVQTYPDLMNGIDELTENARTQMPDLLMEAKNDTVLDSPCSSICPLMSTEILQTVSECGLPSRSNYPGSEPMDVGFGELSEDLFTARSNPITFYGIDKSEEIPWMDNTWGPANHTVEAAATVDTWPEELATIVPSSCPSDLSPSCYVGLDSLMMSAPIGTPKCVSFSDDESCVSITVKEEKASRVLFGPQAEIRSENSVNSVAEPAVLDDVVLTALSKILEDASKEWQAERQKSNATDGEMTALCSTLSVSVADKELKQETTPDKISVGHTTGVEIPASPMMQTPKPIIQMELESGEVDEANHVDSSESFCPGSQSNMLEGNSLCVDRPQQDNRPVQETLEHCVNDAKKKPNEAEEAEPLGTACTPAGELDDLDKLMQMLKALNEETKFCNDETELTSNYNIAATNSCQTLTKDNSSELALGFPNNFCDRFSGVSFSKAHKTSRHVATTANSVHLLNDSNISANRFTKEVKGERACQFDEKNRKDRCKWKMTYVSGLKFLFQRLLHSPDQQSRCSGKYSIKSLGNERLALCISKNKSKFNVKS